MRERDRFGHRRHPDRVGAEGSIGPDLRRGLVGRAGISEIHPFAHRDPERTRGVFRELPQGGIVDPAHVGKSGAERVLVRADERVRPEGVDVIGQEHEVARLEGTPNSAGGIGQHDRADAEPREGTRREDHVGHRTSFVEVDAPREHGDRRAVDVAEHELSRVTDHPRRDRKVRDLLVRNRDAILQPLGERPQARAQNEPDGGHSIAFRAEKGGAGVEPPEKTRLGHPASRPAMVAVMNEASDPPSSARNPRRAMSPFRVGASPPIPPIWIPMEEKFANPQSANDAIRRAFSDIPA